MYLFISSFYMFRTSQCSSSGDRIVLIHHLVWLVRVNGCLVCRSGGKLVISKELWGDARSKKFKSSVYFWLIHCLIKNPTFFSRSSNTRQLVPRPEGEQNFVWILFVPLTHGSVKGKERWWHHQYLSKIEGLEICRVWEMHFTKCFKRWCNLYRSLWRNSIN